MYEPAVASTQVGFEMSIRKTSRAAAANGSNRSDLSSTFFSLPAGGPPRQADPAPFCRPIPTYHLPLRTADSGLIIVVDGSLFFFVTINARNSEVINISKNFFFQLKTQPHLWIKMSYGQCFATIPSAIGENTHSCRHADNITGHCTRIPVFRSYDRHHHHHHRHHQR